MTSIWVYTSENHGTSIEVPLTPETTVLDVLDCVRDPVRGEGYLVAVAGDTEYILQEGDNAFTFLYEIWSNSGSPLTFLLRYYNQQAEWPPPELEARRHQMRRPHKDTEISETAKMPDGTGDLTLAELQEMASRQQQQMEAQQQVLVAKEQRLKYLKQQEARHAQLASESERLRKIRERVESQELKLKKLRALRGQAEQYRANNGNLNSELDAVKAVFNEKEKELAMAVARVDQLTRQLKDLRTGVNNGVSGNKQAAAAAELEKLRKELLIRNKLNEQQSNTIAAKEKLLNQRHEEVTRMDARIHELQQRLKKRRLQEQQAGLQNQGGKAGNNTNIQPMSGSNVATVEPYIQYAPGNVVKDDSYTRTQGFTKQDPKYQTLPSNVKFIPPGKPLDDSTKSGKQQEMNNNTEIIEEYKLPTVVPMDNTSNNLNKNLPGHRNYQQQPQPQQPPGSVRNNNEARKVNQSITPRQSAGGSIPSDAANQHISTANKPGPPQPSATKPAAGMGAKLFPPQGGPGQTQRLHPSLSGAGDGVGRGSAPPSSSTHPVININEEERQAGSGQSSPASSEASNSSGGIQVKGENEINTSSIGPVSAMIERLNKTTGQSQPMTSGTTVNQSRSNFTQRGPIPTDKILSMISGGIGMGKPPMPHPTSQASTTSLPSGLPSEDSSRLAPDSSHIRPSSTSTPVTSTNTTSQAPHPSNSGPHLNQKPAPTYRYASKNQIANTYMGRLGSAAMEKYQKNLNALYKNLDAQAEKGGPSGKEGSATFEQPVENDPASAGQGHPQFGVVSSPNYPDIASDKGSYKLNTPKHIRRRHSDSENEEMNKALQERQELERQQRLQQQQQQSSNEPSVESKVPNKTEPTSQPSDKSKIIQPPQEKDVTSNKNLPSASSDKPAEPSPGAQPTSNQNERNSSTSSANGTKSAPASKVEAVLRRSKSNLKKEGSRKSNNRVSFDPLALLLDGSLEGELDLVKKVAVQVEDVSTPNDEGITALHNAICAGHYEIVKFLVEFGCDVNSPDSDGWTPLHCAASCNNLPMVRFLVEHGACVFATTISDHETAADKCEEEEDGYDGCSDYLYSIQEKLGITNNGEVYAVFDYQATNTDELSFQIGDKLTVLRKGDETEKEWWWARLNGKEGYIPRNLLGLHPRVIAGPKEVSEC